MYFVYAVFPFPFITSDTFPKTREFLGNLAFILPCTKTLKSFFFFH